VKEVETLSRINFSPSKIRTQSEVEGELLPFPTKNGFVLLLLFGYSKKIEVAEAFFLLYNVPGSCIVP